MKMLLHKVVSGSPKDSDCDIEHPDLVAINDQRLPETWASMSEEDFAKSKFFHYTPSAIGYTQVFKDKDGSPLKEMLSIHFFWFDFDKTGIAVVSDYWGGKVKYFRFGCDHDFHEVYDGVLRGRCLHTYECKKCGSRHTVDSSD